MEAVVVVVDVEARPAVPSASSEGAAVRVSWLPRPTQREALQTTRTRRPRRLEASNNYSQCRPDSHFHTNREFRPLDLAPPRNNCARCRCAPPPSPQHPTNATTSPPHLAAITCGQPSLDQVESLSHTRGGVSSQAQQRAAVRTRRVHESLHTSRPRGRPPPASIHVLKLIQPSDCDAGLFCLKSGLCRQLGHGGASRPDVEQCRLGRHRCRWRI